MLVKKKPIAKKTSAPQTMEELLSVAKNAPHGWKRGDVVEGILVEKSKSALYLDIGGKSEGMVIDREMKAARDYIVNLKVGDKVTAIVTQAENDKGQTLLSLKKAAGESVWGDFDQKLKTGEIMRVKGREVNRGGLIVDVRSLQGFIPASQFSTKYLGKTEELVGKDLEVKVIEVDRAKNRLIFSEKAVSEAGLLKEQAELVAKIKVGEEFSGEVTGVMPFGFFVKVTPKGKKISLEGLVHISEISWEKVDDPSKFYKVGDKVKVKVLAIEDKSGKLNFSIKQLLPDPWEGIVKTYPVEAKVKGEIVRIAPFGAFVHLGPGIEGLIHISKIPVGQAYKEGDKVNCYIESIDKENRRISLGLVLTAKPIGYK